MCASQPMALSLEPKDNSTTRDSRATTVAAASSAVCQCASGDTAGLTRRGLTAATRRAPGQRADLMPHRMRNHWHTHCVSEWRYRIGDRLNEALSWQTLRAPGVAAETPSPAGIGLSTASKHGTRAVQGDFQVVTTSSSTKLLKNVNRSRGLQAWQSSGFLRPSDYHGQPLKLAVLQGSLPVAQHH